MSGEQIPTPGRIPTSPEQRVVLGAVALLAFLLVAFYVTSCRGGDSEPVARASGNASTAGPGRATRTVTVAVATKWSHGRCNGPWLDQRARDRVFDSLDGPAKKFAYIPPGIYNGGYGICFH
jgi:hypothetical protein